MPDFDYDYKRFNPNLRKNLQMLYNDQLVFLGTNNTDSFDNAIVGVKSNQEIPKVVYSEHRIIDTLQTTENMRTEVAIEWYEYNIQNSNVDEKVIIIDCYDKWLWEVDY